MLKRTSILKQPYKISQFNDIYKLQKDYQEKLISATSKNQFVWVGEHELCYTMGRGSDPKNLLSLSIEDCPNLFKIDRGGEVTCHMPGQLVVYMVLNLNYYKKDLNWYLRKIENIIINVLHKFNVVGFTKKGFTGVWCGNNKIASVGIGCKRWITIHGFSINVNCDLENFTRIIPCGIKECKMTNMSDFNSDIQIREVKKFVKKFIQEEFNMIFIPE